MLDRRRTASGIVKLLEDAGLSPLQIERGLIIFETLEEMQEKGILGHSRKIDFLKLSKLKKTELDSFRQILRKRVSELKIPLFKSSDAISHETINEIVRLASIYRLNTKEPRYNQQKIAEMMRVSPTQVSKTLRGELPKGIKIVKVILYPDKEAAFYLVSR